MTRKEINDFKTSAVGAIDGGRLCEAIRMVRELPSDIVSYGVRRKLDDATEHYRYMLRYFTDGAADPSRHQNYDDLRADLRMIVDCCVRAMLSEATPTLYYNNVRTYAVNSGRGITDTIDEYLAAIGELSATFGIDDRAETLRRHADGLAHELFNRVWTTFPMEKSASECIGRIFGPDSTVAHGMRMRMVAALGLGLMEFYDVRRICLLADILDCVSDEREAEAAVAWLLLAMFRYRKRSHPRSVGERLAAAAEHPLWRKRIRTIYLELLRARDTERVSRQIREEMMPDIMKLGRDIIDIRSIGSDENMELDINPEWEERLRENGMYDRMREFSEMTAEGADVFMGAFSHLKNYPFFSNIDAWFTPFDESQQEVSDALSGDMHSFVDMLTRMPMPCDNDKFSILFSLSAAPADKREMIGRQLESQRVAMEHAGAFMNAGSDNGGNARSYVQNLYRFFKLYSRRNEFFDPFAHKFFIYGIEELDGALKTPDILKPIAELLFKIQAWEDLRKCLDTIASVEEPTPEIYQKRGYCCEQLGMDAEAADNYGYADLMDGTSAWTLKRLAATLRRCGRSVQAVDVLRRLCRMQPDSSSTAINLAYALIESGDYVAASVQLREVEERGGAGRKLDRALAWCAFMSGDMDTARERYRSVLHDAPTAQDFLNAGHFAWAEGRIGDAVVLYRRTMNADGLDITGVEQAIRADFSALSSAGVNIGDLPLILDAVVLDIVD